jgi:hypothetical protein
VSPSVLQFLPVAILVVIGTLESVLSLQWNWTYFSVGIRIFHRVRPVLDPKATTPSEESLEAALFESAFPPMAFWLLEPDRFAFRERISGGVRLGYLPVMRGNIRLQRRGARVEVIGLVNWFTVALLAAAGYSVFLFRSPIFLVLTIVVLLLIYAIQFRRFSEVARETATEWSLSRTWPTA